MTGQGISRTGTAFRFILSPGSSFMLLLNGFSFSAEGIKSFEFNIEDIEGLRYRSNVSITLPCIKT